MKTKNYLILSLILLVSNWGCNTHKLSPEEARQIAKEAYIYGFPMVMNYKTLYAYTLDKKSPEYKGELNQKSCEARLYTPEDKAVVTPNSDTPYCMFWCDIRKEPVVISVPEIEADRYYSFQLIDLYTHNFAYIGTLTTGNAAGRYLIATTDWEGEKPDGVTDIFRCETNLFLNVVRTQLIDDSDIENIRSIQDQYQLQTLSEFLGNENSAPETNNKFPDWNEGDQFTIDAFNYLSLMLKHINPIEEEKVLIEKFALLGLGTEAGFDTTRFDAETLKAIKEGVKDGFSEIEGFIKQISTDPLASSKIFGTREFLTQSARENYGLENIYLPRAVAAQLGLYGNSGFEAIYPIYLTDAEGNPLNASENKYGITFDAGQLPPVKAFWSITMYDGKTQLLIDNPLDKYLVNSTMMNDFVLADDGSLTIYIQKESPGKALEVNWLPAPDGPFYAVMRLYGPEKSALSGEWKNPPMVKSN